MRYSRSADSVDCGLISQKTFRRWMRCFSYSIVCGINIYIIYIYIYIHLALHHFTTAFLSTPHKHCCDVITFFSALQY